MPSKKVTCPECGKMKSRSAKTCRQCVVPYVRTVEWRQNMSRMRKENPARGYGWHHSDKTRQKMKDVWTPERRAAKSKEVLQRNPLARYHGLSAKEAKKIVQAVSHCENCDGDGSESRLGIHHRNRDKHDHSLSNLIVLCHRCHMQEHAKTKETGWDSYHRNQQNRNPD